MSVGDNMKSDIEIANMQELLPIEEVAKKLHIEKENIECYGNTKAKLGLDLMEKLKPKEDGKLILVTSTSPTPFGEGKTTMSIGIHDALCKLGYSSLVTLREPSLGPVFGIKGGATGGGYAQVVPMEEINLHFTGDMHAITSANNLLSAAIDNHIFQGNALKIDRERIEHPRCMDMNDRALRHIEVSLSKNETPRKEKFVITVASELMAILCLASDLNDLKRRIANMLIAYNEDGMPIYVSDLGIEDAMTILMKDAIKPNLVQTLEQNPAIIHGGPFANIAHGCNSVIATKLSLKLADYVVTEAGFGSELGAEKFLDIKCPKAKLKPNVIVLNTTIRSMKYHGGVTKEDLETENLEAIQKGLSNLKAHYANMKLYTEHVIVCINQFATDTKKELEFVCNLLEEEHILYERCEAHTKGGKGALALAQKILELAQSESDYHPLYDSKLSIQEKIECVATKIYHASSVEYLDGVLDKIKSYENMGKGSYPVCIAKTQYSFSDDAKKLGDPRGHKVTVRDVKLNNGAEFIVVYMGSIMTMPGLSKEPAMLHMKIDEFETISGLF